MDNCGVKVVYDDKHEAPEWVCINLDGFQFSVAPMDDVETVASEIRKFISKRECSLSPEVENVIQFSSPHGTSTNPFYGVTVNGVGAIVGYDLKSAREFYNAIKKAISNAVEAERNKWKERWNDSI